MIIAMRGFVGAIALVVTSALTSCAAPSSADQANEVARELCTCLLPADPTCETQLAPELNMPSQQCIDCVFDDTNACAAMENDCLPLCTPTNTPGDKL
jgi:hypothetical protein